MSSLSFQLFARPEILTQTGPVRVPKLLDALFSTMSSFSFPPRLTGSSPVTFSLNSTLGRSAWAGSLNGKEATEIWLAKQLRPFGVKSRTLWIGEDHAKGYLNSDFQDIFLRYISRSELKSLKEEWSAEDKPGSAEAQPREEGQAA